MKGEVRGGRISLNNGSQWMKENLRLSLKPKQDLRMRDSRARVVLKVIVWECVKIWRIVGVGIVEMEWNLLGMSEGAPLQL